MKTSARTVSLAVLLCVIVGFVLGIAYRAHRASTRARGLLQAVRELNANGNGTQQMQAIAQRYGLETRCEQDSCIYYTLLQNPITLQRLRAPRVEMSFSMRVDKNRLALLTITFTNTDVHRGMSAGVLIREDFQPVAGQSKLRVHQLAGEAGRGVQASIAITPNADASVRDAAFDLNTDCLTRMRGCSAPELAPKAFALPSTESQE